MCGGESAEAISRTIAGPIRTMRGGPKSVFDYEAVHPESGGPSIRIQRNAAAIAEKRAQLQLGEVEALPVPDHDFDRACPINCIYFWEPPERGFAELRRVLKPGGALTIVARHKQLDTHRQYTPDVICALMKEAGFSHVTSEEGAGSRFPVFCVTGLA